MTTTPDKTTTEIAPAIAETETSEWLAVRRQHIAALHAAQDRTLERWVDGYITSERRRESHASIQRDIDRVASYPGWLAARPPRRMPPARRVAEHWHRLGAPFAIDIDEPACFGCGLTVARWSDLERAHMIDRFLGGLDHEANLAMLCALCHRLMPMFDVGDEAAALHYVQNSGSAMHAIIASADESTDKQPAPTPGDPLAPPHAPPVA